MERVILFSYSGHGLLDLAAYDDFLNDRLDGHEVAQTAVHPAGPTAPAR